MNADRKARARDMLDTLRRDCEKDTALRDGKPLTGENVARWLGEDNAKIAALANVLIELLGTEGAP